LQGRRADLNQGVALLLAKEIVTAEDFPAIRSPETRAGKAIELQPLMVVNRRTSAADAARQ